MNNPLYKTLELSVLPYGTVAWTLLSTDAAALRVLERKVLHKIFVPVRIGDHFRIQSSRELYELLNDIDVLKRISIQQLRWLAMSFIWRNMHRADWYLMRRSVEVVEEDDLVCVGRTRSRKPWHRLV